MDGVREAGMTRPFAVTSLGSKIVAALTGFVLTAFVIFHMLGNLQVFQGRDALNSYAAFLRELPLLLWSARIGLFVMAALHVGMTLQLAIGNRRARPVSYARREYRKASLASRTMALSGTLLLLFIVFHLLHLTAGVIDTSFLDRPDLRGHRDVYGRVIHAFQTPWIVIVYVVGQAALALHLSHGVSSMFQTWGFEHPLFNRFFRSAGPLVAGIVVGGNIAIILAIAFGVLRA
ncbi:MAG TPA: succinate dehydrogenase cytochrome b subunit [Nitrospira sp.]|nr:succinate dehydrogenase cytochrome b subunit [Nitrospira sp.]